jgi:uncharacterized protein (TIGR02466 family)
LLDIHFPVAIYVERDLFGVEQNRVWRERALEIKQRYPSGSDWEGGTYTTLNGSYSMASDAVFMPLVGAVTGHVNEFARLHASDFDYKPMGGWLNVSEQGNSQEFHAHNDAIISAVYYIATPANSGKIVFEDPKQPDMLPLRNLTQSNQLNADRVGFEPKEGMLLIFRAYLRHMVTRNLSGETRVSASFNF